mgnify:CR=1 FL=1
MPESVLILFGFLALCVRKNRLTVKYTGEQIDEIRQIFKSIQIDQTRTVANEACDAGRVLVNDKPAKASVKVKQGDIIEIQFGTRTVKVEVLDIKDTTKKEEAGDLFKYL